MKKLLFLIFFFTLGIALLAQTPSITVTSPNGGEVWTIGSTHHITWNYTNLSGTVRIQLMRANSTTMVTTIIDETPIETGSYTWTIPSTILPGVDYRIHIVWVSMLTVYFGDVSDAGFSIISTTPNPTLTLLSPNGGENWTIGSTHAITWTSTNLSGNIRIMLVSSNTTAISYVIASSVPVLNGTYSWTIPSTIPPGTNYRVFISSLASTTDPSTATVYDYSDNVFTILGGGTFPSIRIISPNGGENWTIGSTRYIRWTATALTGNALIQLVKGAQNEVVLNLANAIPINRGIFTWTIPAVLPSDDYKIKITSLNPGTTFAPVFDLSDNYFRIRQATTPRLTLISPNGGEIWETGSTHNITWSYSNLSGFVSLMLINGSNVITPAGSPVFIIATNIPVESGSFSWSIPATIPPGISYKVRIVSVSPMASTVMAISDQSDHCFSIVSPVIIDVSAATDRSDATIRLSTPVPTTLSVKIYNLRGQLVKTLADRSTLLGTEIYSWNRTNNEQKTVSSGIYLVRVQTDSAQYVKRLQIIR